MTKFSKYIKIGLAMLPVLVNTFVANAQTIDNKIEKTQGYRTVNIWVKNDITNAGIDSALVRAVSPPNSVMDGALLSIILRTDLDTRTILSAGATYS